MAPKDSGFKNIPDKLTDTEKKKKQQENKAKANPKQADAKKAKNDACRGRRKESGSSKSYIGFLSCVGMSIFLLMNVWWDFQES